MRLRNVVGIHLLLSLLITPWICLSSSASEARDITQVCQFSGSFSKNKITALVDRDYGTVWLSEKEKDIYIEIETPPSQAAYGLYFCSAAKKPQAINIQIRNMVGQWTTIASTQGKFAHEYIAVNGLTKFRIVSASGSRQSILVSEIYILSNGTTPTWIQQWVDAPKHNDLMLLVAHPDDEILFFGGLLPYYSGSIKKNVIVAYMTCNTIERRSELLNAIWRCGVRIYPDIGDFYDKYTTKLETGYQVWGKMATMSHITSLIREYRPDVILSHDINGEYGHGAHRVCADAVQKCMSFAADKNKYSESADNFGIWQVKKLYLHLYNNNMITMDWDIPLIAFGDMTGYEVAVQAYAEYKTQENASQKNKMTGKYEKFVVEPKDSPYSCYSFGLVSSFVGSDIIKVDFLENIN